MSIAGATSPAPGVSGRAVSANAASAPAHSTSGLAPGALDTPLAGYVEYAARMIATSKAIEKRTAETLRRLDEAPPGEDLLDEADTLVGLHLKAAQASTGLVKAVDGLARLQSFMAGGPDSRPDLSSKSEGALLELLVTKLDAMGYEVVPKAQDVTPKGA